MKRSAGWHGVGSLLVLAACAAPARAEMTYSPPHWEAYLAPGPNSVIVHTAERPPIADAGIMLQPSPTFSTYGPGTLSMTLLPFINTPLDDPKRHLTYTFTAQRSRFGMYIYLTDIPSHQSRGVEFTGYFSGTMTDGASQVAAVFTSPETQTVRVGGYMYTLHVSYSPVGPPASFVADFVPAGAGGAFRVDVDGIGMGPIGTPEPSTFILAAFGLPLAGLACWRARRRTP